MEVMKIICYFAARNGKMKCKMNIEEHIKPYTIEELHARIAQSERDFAEGRYRDIEELFREWDEEEAIIYAAEPEPGYNA